MKENSCIWVRYKRSIIIKNILLEYPRRFQFVICFLIRFILLLKAQVLIVKHNIFINKIIDILYFKHSRMSMNSFLILVLDEFLFMKFSKILSHFPLNKDINNEFE